MMSKRPIITIKEARRLLGKDAKSLNDVEVMEVVNYLHELAIEYFRNKSVKTSNTELGLDYGLPESESKQT